MNMLMNDLMAVSAEIFILLSACAILIIDVLSKDPRRTTTFVLTQLVLAGAAYITFATSTGQVVHAFNGLVVDDVLGDFFKLVLYIAVILSLFYARPYLLDRPQMARGEFYVITLFATVGMMVMISSSHFMTIYLGLELLSLSMYALVAMNRDCSQSSEAAMKYFVLGAIASGLLLYGMSMVYGATGSLNINHIQEAVFTQNYDHSIMIFGLVFIVAGLAFKLGVVPFHMWVPDVYHGSPTAVTLLIGGAPKLAAFVIVVRLLVSGMLNLATDWQQMLIILSVLSMGIGNLAAIAQTNIKRMLAYSAISHMGFMLLGLVSGVVGGSARFALNAYSSSMFYVITYVITTLASFGMIMLMARSGFEADKLEDFKGLNQRSPWLAAMMMVIMFSLAGIPFFVGFFAKFTVLQAVILAAEINSSYYYLAGAAVFFSLIGAFYYLRVVKYMYFDEATEPTRLSISADRMVLISANSLLLIVLGLTPNFLIYMCQFVLKYSL